jgi:histidinol dehydrogenase
MKRLDFSKLSEKEQKAALERSAINLAKAIESAREISRIIRSRGLEAVLAYARKFDKYERENIRVSEAEIAEAILVLPDEHKRAIEDAAKSIEKFHELQRPHCYEIETRPGVFCERVYTPIDNVGLYIPGGTATLPSTALMLGIPARLAGCRRVVLVTPAANKVPPAVLFAAHICGIKEIYAVGGQNACQHGSERLRV